MHLQADAVAEAVREEGARDPARDRVLGADAQHAGLTQYAGQREMRVEVQLPVIEAGPHACGQRLLGIVQRPNQGREIVVLVCRVGASDVRGIAAVVGTGVDQEAAQRVRRQPVLGHVMQHGCMGVERDDVAVGQLAAVLSCRLAVRHVDAELAGAGAKRTQGRVVAAHGGAVGGRHHFDFIRGLEGAVVIEIGHRRRRVVGDKAAERAVRFAEDGAAGRIAGQVRQCFLGGADHDDVEMRRPIAGRRGGDDMPVIVRLQEQQLRSLPGGDHQPTAGGIGQRQPGLELGIGRVGIFEVIERAQVQVAAGDDQMRALAAAQRLVGTCFEHGEVGGIE